MQSPYNYDWPENIRELKNIVHAAVTNCEPSIITASDLPRELGSLKSDDVSVKYLDGDMRTEIEIALNKTGENRSQAAKLLGASRATFYRMLKIKT